MVDTAMTEAELTQTAGTAKRVQTELEYLSDVLRHRAEKECLVSHVTYGDHPLYCRRQDGQPRKDTRTGILLWAPSLDPSPFTGFILVEHISVCH